mgnify:CR=1 FL=1|tara:strand:+ start:215 stop:463 length:249 start_codon:yes stop_codon:yes gene_type:complete
MLIKANKYFHGIINNSYPTITVRPNEAKIVQKPSNSIISDLHGMQGAAVRVCLAPSRFLLIILISLTNFHNKSMGFDKTKYV